MSGLVRGEIGGLLAVALVAFGGNAAAEERYVLVRTEADLYVAPRADAARLNPSATPQTAGRPDEAVVHRLLEERDGWLALETVPESEWGRHCEGGLRTLAALRLRVFARADARVPVTTRTVHQSWPDGTAVALAPGVPLAARAGQRWRATLGAVAVELGLPADAVGGAYVPGAMFPPSDDAPAFVEDATVRAGDLRLKEGRLGPASDLPIPLLFARSTRSAGEDLIATLDLHCGRVDARVAPAHVHPRQEAAPLEIDAGSGLLPGRLRVLAGATAHWPDGTVAGRVDAPTTFHREVPSVVPELRCLQKPLRRLRRGEGRLEARSRLVLCFAPSEISS